MSEKLLELVKKGESEEVEFKKSTAQLDRALKSVCSFLNHKGGRGYFGISKGKIVGQEVSDQTLKSISQKIRQRIKPEISPGIKVLEIDEKRIIAVIISEGKNKPYYLDGIAYKRVGTENIIISPEELERIILEKRRVYWDSQIYTEVRFRDIDEEKVRWFVNKAKTERNLKIDEKLPIIIR
jgi:ATP-dependent DNA helicase RecG